MNKLLTILLLGISLPSLADSLPMPADTPTVYREECGSCHIPYPPALLAASDWQRLIDNLDRHFGSNAAVDAAAGKKISDFLERNAGNSRRLGLGGEPPRISQTRWFNHEHGKIVPRVWQDPRVKSPANCEACHQNAAKGNFSEHEVRIPGGGK